MKSSIKKRIKITRTGKAMHRIPGFNHFRAKKSSITKQRGRKMKKLGRLVNMDA